MADDVKPVPDQDQASGLAMFDGMSVWHVVRAVALGALVISGLWLFGFRGSDERRTGERRPDESKVAIAVKAEIGPGERAMLLRRQDGQVVRAIVTGTDADVFVNQSLGYLEQKRKLAKEKAERDLAALFDQVFSDREQALKAYADWFFAFGRSWTVLSEGVKGGMSGVLSPDGMMAAAEKRIEQFFVTHYKQFVLKPETRDERLTEGVQRILASAHVDFRHTLESLDNGVREFVVTKSRHVEIVKPGELVAVKLDWDSQKMRAEFGGTDAQVRRVWTSAGVAVVSTVLLAPIIEATVVPLMSEMVGSVMASMGLARRGGGGGRGWSRIITVGVAAITGLFAEWGVGKVREHMQRDQFMADNRAALDATMKEWKGKIAPPLGSAIDVWFNDGTALAAKWQR